MMPGVIIHKGAIVSAGTVANKSIPAFALVAGIRAGGSAGASARRTPPPQRMAARRPPSGIGDHNTLSHPSERRPRKWSSRHSGEGRGFGGSGSAGRRREPRRLFIAFSGADCGLVRRASRPDDRRGGPDPVRAPVSQMTERAARGRLHT